MSTCMIHCLAHWSGLIDSLLNVGELDQYFSNFFSALCSKQPIRAHPHSQFFIHHINDFSGRSWNSLNFTTVPRSKNLHIMQWIMRTISFWNLSVLDFQIKTQKCLALFLIGVGHKNLLSRKIKLDWNIFYCHWRLNIQNKFLSGHLGLYFFKN